MNISKRRGADTLPRDTLERLLGDRLAAYASVLPRAMARELAAGDQSYLAPFQIGEALLSRLTPEMRDWQTVDVLRAIYPQNALSRTRMQPIAGSVAAIRCRASPGLCEYPYIPVRVMAERRPSAPLIVAVHGSSRNAKELRDELAPFAEEHGCFVLAPLFPLDLDRTVPDEEYKQLTDGGTRYDRALWSMIDELSDAVGVRFDRVFVFGFSGGAQFAQRLPLVDAERLSGVVMGAPTYVTLPDPAWRWPTGLADFSDRFGREPALEAMRALPHAIVCGTADDAPILTYSREELGLDPEAFESYGANRLERMDVLARAYRDAGIPLECHLLDDVSHAALPILRRAKPILEGWLAAR